MEPPFKKSHRILEKVQRAAKRGGGANLRERSYEKGVKKLHLPTIIERRERGDMIMSYKCVEGTEKIDRGEYVIPNQSQQKAIQEKVKER